MLFLKAHGQDGAHAHMINCAFYLTLVLMDIPTGALADVFGRKFAIVSASAFLALSLFVYAGGTTFWQFVIAEVIGALGSTFANGAFSSWLKDRLDHFDLSNKMSLVTKNEKWWSGGACVFGVILGALLAAKNLTYPWIAAGVAQTIAAVIALIFMKEEYFCRKKYSLKDNIKVFRQTIKDGMSYLLHHRFIRFMVLLAALQTFAVQTANMEWPLWFFGKPTSQGNLRSYLLVGIIGSSYAIFMAVGASLANRFYGKGKCDRTLLVYSQYVIGIGIAGTVCARSFLISIPFFLLQETARGFFTQHKQVCVQEHITKSGVRATVNSCDSTVCTLCGVFGLLFFGWIVGEITLETIRTAWLISGAILVVGTWVLSRNGRD